MSTCEEHGQAIRAAAIRRRKKRRAKGQCYCCPAKAEKGRYCAKHAEREATYPRRAITRERKIREGVCISYGCDNTTFTHRKCAECRRLDSEKTLARHAEHIAAGRCRCGKRKVAVPGESCEPCKRKRRTGEPPGRPRKVTSGQAAPAARPASSGSIRAPG